MKIGILQCGHVPEEIKPELGDYDAMFARLLDGHGFDYVSFDVEGGMLPEAVDAADGWLITGSKHGVYEDHPWLPPLQEFIRAVHADNRPIIGVCFGHQVIAQALGGTVVRSDQGWITGPQIYDFDGRQVTLNAWHQDQVVALPEGAKVLAQNDTCPNAALAIGERVLTIQAHPEFGPAMIDGLLRFRAPGVVPDDRIAATTANLNAALDDRDFGHRMAQFFKGPTA